MNDVKIFWFLFRISFATEKLWHGNETELIFSGLFLALFEIETEIWMWSHDELNIVHWTSQLWGILFEPQPKAIKSEISLKICSLRYNYDRDFSLNETTKMQQISEN